ncbi:ArnT family glycosyltransferase [Paraburkholderia caribensis]|uniref:ArnT family glycosyltransferase n=1 Tax=Paraburkholderia caribensis TaxID=75105 RepID=UPI0034D30CB9
MNLRTAASFMRGDGYGFYYDRFFPFPAQTDGPFILPTALAFWIGGVTPFTGQVVNLIYIAAFILLAVALLRRVHVPLWLALFTAMACLSTPGFVENSMNGYGEVPMLTWFFGGLLVLVSGRDGFNVQPARLFWTGFLFGIAYLTKVVALVCVGPALLVLFCVIVSQPGRVRRLFVLGLGLVVPVLCWEIFRVVEIGNVRGYVSWWRFQLGQVGAQSGARRSEAGVGLLSKGAHHLSMLSDMTGVSAVLLGFAIVVPIVLGLSMAFDSKISPALRLALFMLTGVTGLYFLWWIFISPTAMTWLRRILDGLLLLQCLIAVLLSIIWARPARSSEGRLSTTRLSNVLMLIALLPVVIGQLSLIRNGQTFTRPPEVANYQLDTYKLADAVRRLPADATIFGAGWWQAPAVALFSGRNFSNFEHWRTSRIDAVSDKYFIADMYTIGISQSTIDKVLARSQHQQLVKMQGGELYKLGSVQPYPPFAPEDTDVSHLSSGFDLSNGDYSARRGFFPREEGRLAWAGLDTAVMLKRDAQTTLDMRVEVPPDLRSQQNGRDAILHVTSPGCLDASIYLVPGGQQSIHLPLTCAAWPEARPFEVELSVDQQVPFIVQIDSDNRLRSFRLLSMRVGNGK